MSATGKTHGMGKRRVEADWPPLTLSELRALLAGFPGGMDPVEILTVSPRPFSAASVVNTTVGRIFVKRQARNVRDREGLLEEHRFLNHLSALGAPVPRVFSAANGETAIELGEWMYEVHEAPRGVDIYEDALSWTPFRSTAHARSAGEVLAYMHLAAEGYDAPRRKPRPLVAGFTIFAAEHPQTALARYIAARPALAADATVRAAGETALELLAPFHAELRIHLPALVTLWTHNDLHASNLLWSDASDAAQATFLIDFGLADRSNAAHDLAHAIERNIIEWLELTPSTQEDDLPVHLDHLEALLDGYDSVRPLSEDEASALAPMTALCHAEFALTEADYFLGVLHSEKNARVCVEEYLVGHARWFRSASGTRLLDAIRHWVDARDRVEEC
jgi:Ser/Thr protein kinase RdoA (MazF antagonist)